MNNKLQTIIAFVSGLAIGGVVAAYVIDRRYEDIVQEELDSLNEWKERMHSDDVIDVEVTIEEDEDVETITYPPTDTERVDYTKPSIEELMEEKGYLEEEYEGQLEDEEPLDEQEQARIDYLSQPQEENRPEEVLNEFMETRYPISQKSFYEENPHFEKITITYFDEDETLADDQDEIIPDIDRVIGPDGIEHIGWLSDNPDIGYVRNEDISCDFEICRINGAYEEMVMGVTKPNIPKEHRNGKI